MNMTAYPIWELYTLGQGYGSTTQNNLFVEDCSRRHLYDTAL